MPDTPASLGEASTPTPRRSFWPWILLAVVALGGATFWFADGPNRYRASQHMHAGRVALLASDLPKALTFFRAAALLRPTDEAVIVQYDQTQARWVEMAEQKIAKLDATAAYLAWHRLPPTEALLVEPHLGHFRDRAAEVDQAARGVVEDLFAQVDAHREAAEFDEAYTLLKSVEPLRGVAAELPARLKAVQDAQVAHVTSVATELMHDEKFADAREVLKPVVEIAAHDENYRKLGPALDEAEVRANLRDAGAAVEKGELKSATELLARATELKVLPKEVAAAQEGLREAARQAATSELAQGIVANDRAKVEAALEKGMTYAGWAAAPVESLLEPADLPSFLKSLEAFKLGAESQAQYPLRADIPLVMYSRKKFPEAVVTEYLKAGFLDWSRRAEKFGLNGMALFLDEQAQAHGAEVDAAWRKEITHKAAESAHVSVAVTDPSTDADAPAGLNEAATAAFKKSLQASLGDWPKLVDYDPAHPPTVVFTGRFAGFDVRDDPDTHTKTVRYQSGTRQVPNEERRRLVREFNEKNDERRQLIGAINNNEYKVSRLNSGEVLSDWERSDGIGASGALIVQRYQLQKLDAEMDSLQSEGESMPITVSEPVYADEEYEVIDHHYTGLLSWQMDANMHGQEDTVAEWTADTKFDTREVAGDASHGVPVKKPGTVPREKMKSELAKKVAAKVSNVDAVVERLPDLTMQAFGSYFEKKQANALASTDQYLALHYAWVDAGRRLSSQDELVVYARKLLSLPD